MKGDILIITCSNDAHADFLTPKIENLGTRVFRFDTDKLGRYEIDFRVSPELFSIKHRRSREVLSGIDIGTVWYRKPSPDKSLDSSLDDESIRFLRGETKEFVKSITFALQEAFWVTSPQLLYRARIKTAQLAEAKTVGLSVPLTLISKDRRVIRNFFDKCSGRMIAKTLKLQYVESEDSYHTLRTQAIGKAELRDPSLYVSPSIFQERIDSIYELRIVAIGRRLFPFKVVCKRKNQALDIRSNDLSAIEYSPCAISTDLHGRILRLLDRFSLSFSSMDFLVDKKGMEYFVDLNPNGQWLWLELRTKVIMSDVFAAMLVTRKIPR